MRVAGVEVGRIAGVKLEEGVAVVTLEIEPEYDNLIREDATALLRPKTALKDMFVEVDPGPASRCPRRPIPVGNTLPDINPDEIYSALDADTRPYLKLLVTGAGKGLHNRGDDLREVFRRLEPIHRDLARVTRATAGGARAEGADPRVRPPDDRAREASAGSEAARDRLATVFDTLAKEDVQISDAVARLPGSLNASSRALARCGGSRRCCAARSSRCARRSGSCPRRTPPSRRSCARPSRCSAPRSGRSCARRGRGRTTFASPREDTAKATPDLKTSFGELTASSTWAPTTRAARRA